VNPVTASENTLDRPPEHRMGPTWALAV